MKKAVVVYLPPAKANIVCVDKMTIEDVVQSIVKELLAKGVDTGKRIIYCQTYSLVTQFYQILGCNYTSSPGAVNLAKYQICLQSAVSLT